MNNLITPQARTLLSEGRSHHYRFFYAGNGGMPEEGYANEWWTEILKSQESIPPEGRMAMEVVKKTGVPIKGIYIRHEAPRLLVAPKETPKPKKAPNISYTSEIDVKAILGVLGAVLLAAGTVLGFMALLAIRIDPILYVVTEDGSHVEVAKWYDYITP